MAVISKNKSRVSWGAFDMLVPEKPPQQKRMPLIAESPALQKMERAFSSILRDGNYYSRKSQEIKEGLKSLEFCKNDVETFAFVMAKYQRENGFSDIGGLFLSSMANLCREDDFVITVSHLEVRLNGLGTYNTKRMLVRGNVGNKFGAYNSGCLELDGDALNTAGYRGQEGGKIWIRGSVLDYCGDSNEGCSIIVDGGARDYAGSKSAKGSLSIAKGVRDYACYYAKGGTVNVREGARDYAGAGMSGTPTLHIGKNTRHYTAWKMSDGTMYIGGQIEGTNTGVEKTGGNLYIGSDNRQWKGNA